MDIPNEDSSANRNANPYGKVFVDRITRRQRSRGRLEVLSASSDQLEIAARCFLPWEGWQQHLANRFTITEDRPNDRGARPSVALPMAFDKNFAVLHRIAELLARCTLKASKGVRDRAIESGWSSGVYATMAECGRLYERTYRLPSKGKIVTKVLQRWGIWKRATGPSSRTLRRYRDMLGPDCQARAFVDDEVLKALAKPCQKILLGEGRLSRGAYVPQRATSPFLEGIEAKRLVVLEVNLREGRPIRVVLVALPPLGSS